MKIERLAIRPPCEDLPGVETQQQCKLPVAHLEERKAAETAEVGQAGKQAAVDGAKLGVEKVVTHKVLHAVPAAIKAVVPAAVQAGGNALLLLKAGAVGTGIVQDFAKVFPQQAALRASAIGRENHDLAMAFVTDQAKPGVFPRGYVASRRDELMGPNAKLGDVRHTPHVVNRVVAKMEDGLETDHAGAKSYVSYWATNVGAGLREAQASNVRDQASLEKALQQPAFSAAYQTDPAFREGVRAAMWQAKTSPAAFDAARAAAAGLADSATAARLGSAS